MKKFFLLFFATASLQAMDHKRPRSHSAPHLTTRVTQKPPLAPKTKNAISPELSKACALLQGLQNGTQLTRPYSIQEQNRTVDELISTLQREQPDGNLLAFLLALEAKENRLSRDREDVSTIEAVASSPRSFGSRLFNGSLRRRKSSLDKEIEKNAFKRFLVAYALKQEQQQAQVTFSNQ